MSTTASATRLLGELCMAKNVRQSCICQQKICSVSKHNILDVLLIRHPSADFVSAHSPVCITGVIFWQWGFAPYVAEEFLEGCIHCQAIQVSSSDGVFKNVIAPAAEHAAQVALSRSPAPGCKPGMGLPEGFPTQVC